MAQGKNLSGMRFSMLKVISFSSTTNGRIWHCECDCGCSRKVSSRDLTDLRVKSCGCLLHGKIITPEYRAWQSLKDRCYNEKYNQYKNYGGRGITVCDRWKNSFIDFFHDMGSRPSRAHSMDRIDVNGNYEKDNCKWSTIDEQKRNRTNSHIYTYKGVTKSLTEHGRDHGLTSGCVWVRVIKMGWDLASALETPVRKR